MGTKRMGTDPEKKSGALRGFAPLEGVAEDL